MSVYTNEITKLEERYSQIEKIKQELNVLADKLEQTGETYKIMLEAQQILGVVSDSNTQAVLSYVTSIINKALSQLFPNSTMRLKLEKTMFQGQHAHINFILEGENGKVRDLQLQTGTGLRQVISFLFIVSIIEIRKCRKIFLADELLSGLHPKAKEIIKTFINIFAEGGFQFAFVEYGIDDIGKIYVVEKKDGTATITPIEGAYHQEVFLSDEATNMMA